MYESQTVFAQLMQNLSWTKSRRIVHGYRRIGPGVA